MQAADAKTHLWVNRRRLRDYAKVGRNLLLQRIAIYSAAIFLAGAYYDWRIALAFYALVWAAEAYDIGTFRRILSTSTWDSTTVRRFMREIYVGTAISASVISLFCVSVSIQQGTQNGHFMPLFMLFSASIFAAMNNRHFLPVLALRLAIYVAAILFIPIRDLAIERPPLASELWMHFFTVIFVLVFIIECSRSFLAGYNENLRGRRELEEEHERTKAAYLAKTQFLSTVSHELRTPLTSIKGSLEIINSGVLGQPPEKLAKPLDIATRNTRRLADLVNDLLLLQKAEAGKIDFHFEIADLGALITEAVERFRPFADRKNITVAIDLPDDTCWARFDKMRLDQVITNLLSNAAKFSEEHAEVRVSLAHRGDDLRVSVTDEGIGIDEGARGKLFEEFSQLDSSNTRKFEGTGLGLNISKRIIEAHQGQINYTSELGVGSTFFIDLKEEDAPIHTSKMGAATASGIVAAA
ncbi:HAMP domain-containing histidine kinase [Antarcticimicrobium luteum]|uniref:histidine kinase n=1 Tax=Antarcticimicrobium luteum TaxID=2547397 RepID=A0A4R5VDP2_9RHOB|nr:HAMP domain-containing histidine kinase [Antarcticimicrobium luteum]